MPERQHRVTKQVKFSGCVQYAEMEMRHRFVNHARNVWDRAVSLLPRIDQLWYK
jgi:hypothetical protein